MILFQVGEDVVGELTKAMERLKLDMRVTALVISMVLQVFSSFHFCDACSMFSFTI